MPLDVRPFRVHVPDQELAGLRARLGSTRWPAPSPVPGWSEGIPTDVVRDLCRYWAEVHDWRAAEARLNAFPQCLVALDGIDVHVLHVRSSSPGALPLVLTHGWPGSVLEWVDLVGALTDPVAHGASAADAFDVVVPSLPGYGFSASPAASGWGVERIAAAWAQLMSGLGYARYGAAGSDWGTSVSAALGVLDVEHVVGLHLVPPLAGPDPSDEAGGQTESERVALEQLHQRAGATSAYSEVHRTAPQTVGVALNDSPAGLCAWMGEKLLSWTDPRGPRRWESAGASWPVGWRWALTPDQVLDQVSLYWLTGTAASSTRLYAESIHHVAEWIDGSRTDPVVPVPIGASIFGAELPRPSRRWAQRRFPDIRNWVEHPYGGHFPALEQPDLLVDDLRATFRGLR